MNWRTILYFAAGAIVGGVSGVLATKNHYKKMYSEIADQQIGDMEAYYQKKDEYIRIVGDEDEEVNPPEQNDDRSKGPLSSEARADVKQKLERNWKGTTDYASVYKEKHGSDQNEEEPEEETDPGEQYTENHKKDMGKKPRIISQEEAADLDGRFENEVLYYYVENEVLVDDYDNVVDEPGYLVGDALTKYDFIHSEEMVIYVANYELDICYEIQKVMDEYVAE